VIIKAQMMLFIRAASLCAGGLIIIFQIGTGDRLATFLYVSVRKFRRCNSTIFGIMNNNSGSDSCKDAMHCVSADDRLE